MMRVRLEQFHIKVGKHSKIRLESRIIDLKSFKGLFKENPHPVLPHAPHVAHLLRVSDSLKEHPLVASIS